MFLLDSLRVQEPRFHKKLGRSPPPTSSSSPRSSLDDNAAANWLAKNDILIKQLDNLTNRNKLRNQTKRDTLYKSWCAHVFVPLKVYIEEKLEEEKADSWLTKLALYQKFLDYCADPGAILSVQYQPLNDKYDPYLLTRGPHFQVYHPLLKDPLFLWSREMAEERMMLNPDWPLDQPDTVQRFTFIRQADRRGKTLDKSVSSV